MKRKDKDGGTHVCECQCQEKRVNELKRKLKNAMFDIQMINELTHEALGELKK